MARKISQNSGKTNTTSAFSRVDGAPARFPRRVRKSPLAGVWGFIMWIVGVLVSLAVGFGMVDGTLRVPLVPSVVMIVAGWIVVVLTLLGVLLKIIDLAS